MNTSHTCIFKEYVWSSIWPIHERCQKGRIYFHSRRSQAPILGGPLPLQNTEQLIALASLQPPNLSSAPTFSARLVPQSQASKPSPKLSSQWRGSIFWPIFCSESMYKGLHTSRIKFKETSHKLILHECSRPHSNLLWGCTIHPVLFKTSQTKHFVVLEQAYFSRPDYDAIQPGMKFPNLVDLDPSLDNAEILSSPSTGKQTQLSPPKSEGMSPSPTHIQTDASEMANSRCKQSWLLDSTSSPICSTR